MKIVIAPDSFKGSLTAIEACDAIERGLLNAWPEADIRKVPMADGGEGTVASLVAATGGRLLRATVSDPLGRPTTATYGILGDGGTAVIEMAAASGLPLVPEKLRDPKITTTLGTGELIRHALDQGCRRFIIGIGGSATNDAGAGMARALGAGLLDAEGNDLGEGGAELARLDHFDLSLLDPRARQSELMVACDVNNPLCGEHGASAVYGPQKGATREDVRLLDEALRRFGEVTRRQMGVDVLNVPGAGAAGGLGAGLVAFLGAKLRPGVDIVIEAVGLEGLIAETDLVVTGEGRIDRQTLFGKTISGIARVASRHKVPVVALAGAADAEANAVLKPSKSPGPHEAVSGANAIFPIAPGPVSEQQAMSAAANLLELGAERLARLIDIGRALAK